MEDPTTQLILKYAKAGLPQDDIAKLVNRAQGVVSHKIALLKEYGAITQEEINNAKESYIQEIKDDNFRREAILENLRKGRLRNDFAVEIGLTERGVKYIQDLLIAEGKITQSEIDEAVNLYGKEAQREKEAIELLKKGYTYEEASAETGYGTVKIKSIKEKAIREGKLTEEEYQKVRKERQARLKIEKPNKEHDENKEELVLEMLMAGKPSKYITKTVGITVTNLRGIIKKLVEKGKITEEEISRLREKAEKDIERKILMGLEKGYSQQKIAEMFEQGEISQTGVGKKIRKLIDEGKITQEQIEQYKNKAKQKEMNQVNKQKTQQEKQEEKEKRKREQDKIRADKRLIKLLLEGHTTKEIATMLECSKETIEKRTKRLKDEGQITQVAMNEARQRRRKENKAKIQEEKNKKERNYREKLRKAERILIAETEIPDENINNVVGEIIPLACARAQEGKLTKEELDTMCKALFEARQMKVDNVIGISRLYLMMRDYKKSLYLLNYSKELFETEEERLRINEAVEVLKQYKRKIEADQMLKKGYYSIEEIQERNKLSLEEVLEIKNRNNQIEQGKKIEENDVFPDL